MRELITPRHTEYYNNDEINAFSPQNELIPLSDFFLKFLSLQ